MSSIKSPYLGRSTIAFSWRWIWPDTLMRIIPLGLAPFLYVALFHLPLAYLGLTLHNVPQQLAIGIVVGLLMAAFSDHLFQGFFYLVINGPIEELFFRGFMLTVVTQWTGWIGWGWLVSTATYTLYHRLGKWSWRSVGGVGLAGLVFSLVYIAQPEPRSLLAVVIVHGLTTCGFLSWGDELMYRLWKRRVLNDAVYRHERE